MIPTYEPLLDYERAQAWRAPEALRFTIGEARVTKDAILVDGVLANEGASAVEVILFPAYLALQPAPGDSALVLRPPDPNGPPRPAPVPPPPVRFELPAGERVAYTGHLALADYTFAPGAAAEIEWTFTYWTPPLPRGRLRVVLPGPTAQRSSGTTS